jgi:cytochrome c biogenesis protein CcmG/thiol:disulfide interchange protein DsbE
MSHTKVDRILQACLGVFFLGFVALLYQTIHERIVNVGDSAPSFSITADNGSTITAANFGGKVLLVNFWATWCAPCVQEIPSLNQLQSRFRDRGLVVLGISVDKDEAVYRQFVSRFRLSFLTARDPEQKINHDYGTAQFPETFVINAEGKVVNKIVGEANWTEDKMVNYVQSLL